MNIIERAKHEWSKYRTYSKFVGKLNEAIGGNLTIKKAKKLILQLHERTRYLSRQSIYGWRQAHQAALDIENPRRDQLYDIYDDVMLDLHLTAIISQRLLGIVASNFSLIDDDGNEDIQATKLLKRTWFRHFMKYAFQSKLYGHSLIQFDDLKYHHKSGELEFHKVELFPRRHVRPEKQEILPYTYSLKGIKYNQGQFANWLISIGDESSTAEKDLGLLLKIAPQALSKKNQFQFWDEFAELFGMPIRVGKTTSSKPDDINEIEGWLQKLGSSGYGVFPEGTEIELKENAKNDAFNVYDKRIERANSEMSKAILGQTMTTDDGSSRSQSEVHERVAGTFNLADKEDLSSWINDKLLPFLAMHGYPVGDLEFKWDKRAMTLQEQMEVDKFILENFEVDESYLKVLSERYGVPIIGIRKLLGASPVILTGEEEKEQIPKKKDSIGARLERMYGCPRCDGEANTFVAELTEQENKALKTTFDKVTKAMYDNKLPADRLPINLYFDLAKTLMNGVDDNFKNPSYDSPRNPLRSYLMRNIHAFSGAKSLTELEEMRGLLTDENGKPKPFNQFKDDVLKVHKNYNERYLKAEYENTIASAQMADKWQELQDSKELYPYLKYTTVGDSRVRKAHEKIDKIIRPIDDAFWNTHYPPNGWNCRCTVEAVDSGRITSNDQLKKKSEKVITDDYFKTNVGKTGVIYKEDDHPYFENIKGEIDELKAVENYGLRSIKRIYSDSKNLTKPVPNVDFDKWFKGESIIYKDVVGTFVKIEKTISKSLSKTAQKAIANLPAVLSGADEVYSVGTQLIYIRYDLENVLISIVETKNKAVLMNEFKIVTKSKADDYRKGVLIYKK